MIDPDARCKDCGVNGTRCLYPDCVPQPPRPTQTLVLPFPLRKGYLAQVVVPRDLTKDEAERLSAFVTSLAQPERP